MPNEPHKQSHEPPGEEVELDLLTRAHSYHRICMGWPDASICVLSLCLQFQKALTVDVKNRTQYMTQQNQSPKKLSPHLKGTKHTPWIRVKLVHCKRMLLLI